VLSTLPVTSIDYLEKTFGKIDNNASEICNQTVKYTL